MIRRFVWVLMFVMLAGCASRGPVVPIEPTVQVTQLDSLLFTPEVIKFQAKIVINNRMNAELEIQKVDYGADVQENEVFMESFDQLKAMKPRGTQTVTFPFQITMEDIRKHAVQVLADGALRVGFRGVVYPAPDSGFGPITFSATKTITLPKVPSFSIERIEGSPLNVFTVFLKVKNPNTFPLDFQSIDSFININGTKYSLLKTEGATLINAGAEETVTLRMEHSTGKKLSMAWNILQSSSLEFSIGGEIRCGTPDGVFYIPLEISSK